jgi:hypothetical protein
MILSEELYFEINAKGTKSEIKKLVKFLKSGELDDFFEFSAEYISYSDEYADADDATEVELIFSNDDLGIEIDEFDTVEFLELLCKAGRALEISGHIYDISDEEHSFISHAGDSGFLNSRSAGIFNDELDEAARDEEDGDEEYDED